MDRQSSVGSNCATFQRPSASPLFSPSLLSPSLGSSCQSHQATCLRKFIEFKHIQYYICIHNLYPVSVYLYFYLHESSRTFYVWYHHIQSVNPLHARICLYIHLPLRRCFPAAPCHPSSLALLLGRRPCYHLKAPGNQQNFRNPKTSKGETGKQTHQGRSSL